MFRVVPACFSLMLILGIAFLAAPRAMAGCACQCVDGRMQPLCNSTLDLPPICPPTICPIASPSITPINPPTVPPLGATSCRQARVCDQFGNCRWQQVCQ